VAEKAEGQLDSSFARFEVFRCDSDSTEGYGVRIRAQDNSWLTIAEYVSEKKANTLSRGCDADLRG
jgi:hypothetical protein